MGSSLLLGYDAGYRGNLGHRGDRERHPGLKQVDPLGASIDCLRGGFRFTAVAPALGWRLTSDGARKEPSPDR